MTNSEGVTFSGKWTAYIPTALIMAVLTLFSTLWNSNKVDQRIKEQRMEVKEAIRAEELRPIVSRVEMLEKCVVKSEVQYEYIIKSLEEITKELKEIRK